MYCTINYIPFLISNIYENVPSHSYGPENGGHWPGDQKTSWFQPHRCDKLLLYDPFLGVDVEIIWQMANKIWQIKTLTSIPSWQT